MAGASNAERQTIARLTEEVVPTLMERLAKSNLGELEVRQDGWRVRLRRGPGELALDSRVTPVQVPHRPSAVVHASDVQPPRREPPRGQVTSPAVGYFVPRDGVAAGSKLRAGDLIGAVDVLGVRQEVVSPMDGVLKLLEVESGQAVEYGQPIGRVDASA